MKAKTTTRIYSKALARSGPEIRPEQILLDENDQALNTQSDLNHKLYNGDGGPGPGPDPIDLDGYATTEYVDAADDQLKTEVGSAAAKANSAMEKATANTSDIDDLQQGFDAAVLAAKEGAENIEIEFQSTAKKATTYTKVESDATFAKKSDIPEGADLSAYAKKTDIPTDNKDLANGAKYITAADVPEVEVPDQVTYQIQTDAVLRAGEPAIELVDSEGMFTNVKFFGEEGIGITSDANGLKISAKPLRDEVIKKVPPLVEKKLEDYATNESVDQKITALPSPTYIDWNSLPNLTV